MAPLLLAIWCTNLLLEILERAVWVLMSYTLRKLHGTLSRG
jgi:hypothetical protein